MLGHPHTSAGRVPTDRGYRYYTSLLARRSPRRSRSTCSGAHRELETALRTTAESLAQVTNLLAVVSAPSLETTIVRHVELVPLQPQLVMAVVITSTGGVAKRLFVFERPSTPASSSGPRYLDERVGPEAGRAHAAPRLSDPCSARERAFLERSPRSSPSSCRRARCTSAARPRCWPACARRPRVDARGHAARSRSAALLAVLRDALDADWAGSASATSSGAPALRSLSMVAANYGIASRNLGTVSLVGPKHMDYIGAMRAVRGAAAALSDFVEELYDT